MERNNLIMQMAQAIATFEGYFNQENTVAKRNNNPGNLRTWGNVPVVGGYAKFSSPEEGWQALYSQVDRNIDRGLTLWEFFGGKTGVYAGYAPASDKNDPVGYSKYVAGQVGVGVDTRLDRLVGSSGTAGGTGEQQTPSPFHPGMPEVILRRRGKGRPVVGRVPGKGPPLAV